MTLNQLTKAWQAYHKAMRAAHKAKWVVDDMIRTEDNRSVLNEVGSALYDAESELGKLVEPKLGDLYRRHIESSKK